MNRLIVCCLLLLSGTALPAVAQMPPTCEPPASAANVPPGTPPAKVYDDEGVRFAQEGKLDCSVAAFQQALRLEPRSAETHFDLGLVRQRQQQNAAAIKEFRLALQDDPRLLQARCALGSALPDGESAEGEFRKALQANPQSVCALDGLAQIFAGQRQYGAAADYWRRALRVQPDAADLQLSLATAIYEAAKVRQADGRPPLHGNTTADAIKLLTRLIRKHPGMAAAHFTLGNIYANEKLFRKAADEYRLVVRHDPTDMVALAAEVKELIDAGAYADALEPARNYAREKPGDPSGHVLLGTVYLELADFAKAKPELQRGAESEPGDFEAQYEFGSVLASLGKPELALPQLRKALALKPGDRSAQVQIVAVLHALGQKQAAKQIAGKLQKEVGKDYLNSQLASEGNKANGLLQSGKTADAVQIYRHMLEEDPHSAETAYNLALALEAMQDTEGAESVLRRAIDIDPKLAESRAELGRLDLAKGDLQSAQKWLQSALDLQPELVEARANLAMVYAREGNLTVAESFLRQALQEDPKYAEGYLNLGLILVQQNRKSDADQQLDKAVALAPKDPDTLSTAGKAKMQMGESKEGIALLRKVVDLAPNLAAAHLDLARALGDGYDLTAALEQTSDAVRLAPQSGVAHFYRGRVLYDLGRSAEAQSEFETASRLAPQMPDPLYYLALIDKHEGKFSLAAGLLQQTVKLQPRNVEAWFMLGDCLEQESKTDEAIAAWRKTVAIDPKFGQALYSLARALRSTNRAESERLMARYAAVQQEQRLLDRADTLANNGVEAASAHDWPEAIRQFNEAISACGECAGKAELYRKLGIIYCQAGDLDKGEKELLAAKALNPADPVTQAALEMAARARNQH